MKKQAAQKPSIASQSILDCLASEHRHMTALLNLLEHRMSQRQKITQGDYYLMRDVIGYLHDFPDQVHHPTEDLLFDSLVTCQPDLAKEVAGLRLEHEQLATATAALLNGLEQAITTGLLVPEQKLRTQVTHFTEQQRKHMKRENQNLFPAAVKSLRASDWNSLARRSKLHADPLFGDQLQPRHRMLFEFLVHPEHSSMATMMASGMGVQERLIDAFNGLEQGAAEALTILGQAVEGLAAEARSFLANEDRYSSRLNRMMWPWHAGLLMSRTAWQSGSSLLGTSGKTAWQVGAALLRKPGQYESDHENTA